MSTVPSDPFHAALVDMEVRISAAVAKTKRATNGLVDASLNIARSQRKISAQSMPAVRPAELKKITDDDETESDLTGRFAALRQPV